MIKVSVGGDYGTTKDERNEYFDTAASVRVYKSDTSMNLQLSLIDESGNFYLYLRHDDEDILLGRGTLKDGEYEFHAGYGTHSELEFLNVVGVTAFKENDEAVAESKQMGTWEGEPALDKRTRYVNDPQYFSE